MNLEGGAEAPIEAYKVVHLLSGHGLDVNGLEWSADGKYLASCGIDGRVIVWDVGNSFSRLCILENVDRRPLKGLVWDPLGCYLGAQSNDGTLYMWDTREWSLLTCINSPFAEIEESYTYFSRPSWSPDGKLICMSDSVNQCDSVALLVERDRWSCEQSLVGHESAVQVAKFSPRLYRSLSGEETTFVVVALGCQDGILSIWSSKQPSPISVVCGIFEHAIMDIVWSHDGTRIFAASYDGGVAIITLDKDVVGGVGLSPLEHSTFISRIEAPKPVSQSMLASVAQVALQKQLDQASTTLAKVPAATTTTTGLLESRMPQGEIIAFSQPSEVKTTSKDTKRRITPNLIQPAQPASIVKESKREERYSVILGKPSRKSWLTPGKVRPSLAICSTSQEFSFEVINAIEPKDGKGSKIFRLAGGAQRQVIWENRIETFVLTGIATTSGLLIVAGRDKNLYIFSPAGRYLLPPLAFSANVSSMLTVDDLALIILENGLFYLWQVPSLKPVAVDELPPAELGGELLHVEISTLSETVFIEFNFANNRTLVYDASCRAFFHLEGLQHVELLMNVLFDSKNSDTIEKLKSIMALDEAELQQKSLALLEMQVSAYARMGKVRLLQTWLVAYIRRLAAEQQYSRAAEVIECFHDDYRLNDDTKQLVKSLLQQSRSPLIRELADRLTLSQSLF